MSSEPGIRRHRHDQTVAGVLATQLGMRLSSEELQVSSCAHGMGPIGSKTQIVLLRIPSEVRQYIFDRDGRQYQHCGATKTLSSITLFLCRRAAQTWRKTCKVFVRPVTIAKETVASSSARVDRAELDRKAEDRGAKCYQATAELLKDSLDAEMARTE